MHNKLITHLNSGSKTRIMSYCRCFYVVFSVNKQKQLQMNEIDSYHYVTIYVYVPSRKKTWQRHRLMPCSVMHYVISEFELSVSFRQGIKDQFV